MNYQPTTGRQLSDLEAAAEAERIIKDSFQPDAPTQHFATSFRDETPVPEHGTALPVRQEDHRIVPAWAAGVALASVGVGAGITGTGCGIWLALQGLASFTQSLSSVTLAGVLFVTLPLAGIAAMATAIGGAIKGHATTKTVYEGPVSQHNETHNTSNQKGWFARTRNDVH